MRFTKFLAATAAVAMLAGCASRPAPPPEPEPVRPSLPPAPAPLPPPPPRLEWQDLPLTPGEWFYSREASGSQAMFGPPQSEASFILRCDAARRQVVLSLEGAAAQMAIRTSTTARTLPATARTEPLAYMSATLPVSDPFLDAIVFSRGRFAVEAPGLPRLVIPTWPEPARVIEDCRG